MPLPLPPDLPITPTLVMEFDHRVHATEIEGNDGFRVARFRPGLQLAPTPRFEGIAVAEFAGEYASILDAYVRLRPFDEVEVRVGYAKPPLFASFVLEPVHTLPFPDRAPVVSAFGVFRDAGVDARYLPDFLPLELWFRIGNGTGSALGNDNAEPAFYGLLDLVWGRTAAEDETWGGRLGVGGFTEEVRDRDGLVGRTPLDFVYFRPVVVSGRRTVGEAHLIGHAGPVRLTVELATAREERSRDDDGNPDTPRKALPEVQSSGITAELAWTILGEARTPGHPPHGDDGALEVAARYDALWFNEEADDVESGGADGGALAVKWWPAPFLAITAAGYLTRYDAPPIEQPDRDTSWGLITRLTTAWQ